MAITMIQAIPDRETYEAVTEKLFPGGMSDAPDGLIVHTAGEGPNGFRVVDVWESREALERFTNERLMPAVQETGMTMGNNPPEIIELINVFRNEAARV